MKEYWTKWQAGLKCLDCGFEGWPEHFSGDCCPECGYLIWRKVAIRHLIWDNGKIFRHQSKVLKKEIRE